MLLVILLPLLAFTGWSAWESLKNEPAVKSDSLLNSGKKNVELMTVDFIDQNGNDLSIEDMNGKVYIVNFFYATCPSICPRMNNQLRRVQDSFSADELQMLSFTVEPEKDDQEVLSNYAFNFGSRPDQWHLLTGDKGKIYLAARNLYRVETIDKTTDEDEIIHSELVVLMDEDQRIRDYYKGTEEDDIDRLIQDIKIITEN